jgi:hypothetical protein
MTAASNSIREMVDEVIEFSCSYIVWRELMEPSNVEVRSAHPDFLLTITNSMVRGFFVGAYQLFDWNGKTKSLLRLIEDLRSSNPVLAQHIESTVKAQRHVLDKIFSIRNNVYAHRNRTKRPESMFSAAGITPRMLKIIVDLAQKVVSMLAVAEGVAKKDEMDRKFRDYKDYVLTATRRVVHPLTHTNR